MLTIDQHRNASPATAAYQIRLHGGTDDERLVPIPPGKHSVGSGPRCQLRLSAAGVQAMECLLVRDRAGLRVRRWSENTLLNGQPFEEAVLADGDMLSVGPVILEIMGPTDGETPADASDDLAEPWEHGDSLHSACDAIDDMLDSDEAASQVLQPTAPNHDWQGVRTVVPARRGTDQRMDSLAAAISANTAATRSTVRRRSRRALDVLRQQRCNHDELIARVGELERMLAEALAEPSAPSADHIPEPIQQSAADARVAALEGELGSLREQLGARDAELQQSRYAIDALDRQLIDGQQTMNAFAEERVQWEEQFNQIESRLAKYVERIQELELQLESRPSVAASASTQTEAGSIDWAAEAALDSATDLPTNVAEDAEGLAPEGRGLNALATAVETNPAESPHGDPDWQADFEQPAAEVSESTIETVVEPALEPPIEPPIELPIELPDEPTDVSESNSGAAPSTAGQVDEALDHLRGLSIWREKSDAESQEQNIGESSAAAETPNGSADGKQPESFLDRYAHLFADDDPPRPTAEPEDNTAPLTDAVPPPEPHADEESVEQYMAKLLARMRGGPTGDSAAAPDEPPNRPTVRIETPVVREPQEEEAAQAKFTNLDEMKSRATAPEQASDMAAMRALANRSARHALGVHAARKLRRSAITRVIVTALAASVSVYLLLNSATWRSLAFGAGTVAGLVAVYWGFLTLGTLLRGFQLGAFDDLENETQADESLAPPLPIDIVSSADATTASGTDDPALHAKNAPASETAGGTDVVEIS